MKSPAMKAELESALGSRFGLAFQFRERPAPETISCGIAEVDVLAGGGLPQGAITEVCGPASSGRTSLMLSVLAAATGRQEVCALVDTSDAFEPVSAAAAGVELSRLLWIRCGGNAEHAMQVADWLLQGGGFGVAVWDLGDIPPPTARRISLTSWFRLRRAIENTPTVLLVIEQEPQAKSCSSLVLEMQKKKVDWSGWWGGPPGPQPAPWPALGWLLRGTVNQVAVRKPVRSATASFEPRLAVSASPHPHVPPS